MITTNAKDHIKFINDEKGRRVEIDNLFLLFQRLELTVSASMRDEGDLFDLYLLHDAVQRFSSKIELSLLLSFFPEPKEESHSTSVSSSYKRILRRAISSMNFNRVSIFDPYTRLEMDNSFMHHPEPFINQAITNYKPEAILIPADRANYIMREMQNQDTPIIQYSVIEDANGEFVKIFADRSILGDKKCLVIANTVNSGDTYITIAKKLIDLGANSASLYCSHGIFKNGLDKLLSIYTKIFTTNSIIREPEIDARLNVFKVFDGHDISQDLKEATDGEVPV